MKKIKCLLVVILLLGLSACANNNGSLTSSDDPSTDPAAEDPRDTIYTLTLNTPMANDSVVTGNPTHGTCVLSGSFDQITYTLTDTAYMGTDMCIISDSSCSYEFGIDLSQNPAHLVAGSTNCSSI